MKKMLTMIVVLILVTVGASADTLNLNFSFWGRGVFTPLAFSDGYSSVSAATATWNNGAFPRIGFTMNAYHASRAIGIQITSFWDGQVPAVGENANIWVRPLAFLGNENLHDIVEMRLGRWEIDSFRGRIGAVEFGSWIVPDGVQDEDALFSRFASGTAAHFVIRPLSWWDSPWNGLTLMAGIGSSPGGVRAYMNTYPWNARDVYAAGHYAIGYEIPEIGLFRMQFIGNNRPVWVENYPFEGQHGPVRMSQGLLMGRDADVLEAAFTFTGVRNLILEAGVKVPFFFVTGLPSYEYYRAVYAGNAPWATGGLQVYGVHTLEMQFPITVSAGGAFSFGNWSGLLRVDTSFGGRYHDIGFRDIHEGMAIGVLGSVSHSMTDNVRVGLDVGSNFKEIDTVTHPDGRTERIGERPTDEETTERRDIGFAPWVQLDFGGGRVRAGITVMIPSGARWQWLGGQAASPFAQVFTGAPVISFPISVTYSF